MKILPKLLLALAAAAALPAQGQLDTLYAADIAAPAGACVYFDLVVSRTLTVTALDVNTVSLPGTPGSVTVHLGPETWVGKCTQPALWTPIASGAVLAADIDLPTACTLTQPFTLGPGTYGVAIQFQGIAPAVSDGTGVAQTFANADLALRAGGLTNLPFTGVVHEPRVFNGSLHYTIGGTPLALAENIAYGRGCETVQGTVLESFPALPWMASADLDNTTLRFTPNARGGYDVVKLAGALIVPPGVPPLVLGDDSIAIEYAPFAFPYPGGATNDLYVCSNGFIGFEPFTVADFTPTVGEALAGGARLMAAWMDLNPGAPGSGRIHYEVDPTNTFVTITWNNVWQYGGVSFFANRFQVVLRANGEIEIRYGTLYNESAELVVGFTPGHGNFGLAPTLVDFSAGAPVRTGYKQGLSLTVPQRPVLGATLDLRTEHIPAAALVSANLLSITQYPQGIDLTAFGAPGCSQYAGTEAPTLLFGIGTQSCRFGPLPTDPIWIGMPLFTQSIALVPGANALNVLASNGVALRVGGL